MAPAKKVLMGDNDESILSLIEDIDEYRSHSLTWTQIAALKNVNYKWLQRWRKSINYEDPRILNLTEQEIDEFFYKIISKEAKEFCYLALESARYM